MVYDYIDDIINTFEDELLDLKDSSVELRGKVLINIYVDKEDENTCSKLCKYLETGFPMGGFNAAECSLFDEELEERKRCTECTSVFKGGKR